MNKAEQELFALMEKVPRSVSLVDELIQNRRLEAEKENTDLAGCLNNYANGFIPTEQAIEKAWQK